MSINLLPTEKKNKIIKVKFQPAPIVEMTGPVKFEKHKPGIKQGGVLSFFKQAFAKPKAAPAEADKQLPEKKVSVEEKIVYVKPEQRQTPPPAVKLAASKFEAMQVKRSRPIGERISSIFSGLFRSKPKTLPAAIPAPVTDDRFPKYHPIRTEEVRVAPEQKKPRHTEIITVTMNGQAHEPQARKDLIEPESNRLLLAHEGFPKTDPNFTVVKQINVPAPKPAVGKVKVSLWQKISRWWKSLFARPVKKNPASVPAPKVPVAPKLPEPLIMVRTEQKIVSAKPEAPIQPKSVSMPVPKPVAPSFISSVPVSHPSSLVKPLPSIEELKKYSTPLPPITPQKKVEVPLSPKSPVPQPPPPPARKFFMESQDHREEKKTKGDGISWWKKIWLSLLGLFHSQDSSAKKIGLKREGSVQMTPGVRLTEVAGNQVGIRPVEWEVNLVPDDAIERELPISKILIGVMCVIISVALVFGGWIAANTYYSNVSVTISDKNGQIESNRIEINGYQNLQAEVRDFNQKISTIQTLLTKHVYWSQIFNKLEHYTVPEVYLTSMTADVNGSVSLSVIGEDYKAAVKQLEVFNRASDFVSKVTVAGICFVSDTACSGTDGANLLVAPTSQTVKFSVNLIIQPSIFYWPK